MIRSQNGEGSGALPPRPIDPAAEGGPIPVPTAIVAKDNSLVTSINADVNFTGRTLLSNDSGSILMLGGAPSSCTNGWAAPTVPGRASNSDS